MPRMSGRSSAALLELPLGRQAEGKLRFDGEEHFRQGGESGPLFVAGKPDESLLIEQVTAMHRRCLRSSRRSRPLKFDILRRWIAAGGKVDSMPVDDSARGRIPPTYDFAPAITSVTFDPGEPPSRPRVAAKW